MHDQITARICVEYFTIGHPPIFDTDSPTLLGLGWGVIATWWVGLVLGLPLAFAALRGSRPKRTARSLIGPVAILLAWMGTLAAVAGVIGFIAANLGWVVLLEPLASRVPVERHTLFIADLWAHSASYLVGFVGGLILARRVWRSRQRLVQEISRHMLTPFRLNAPGDFYVADKECITCLLPAHVAPMLMGLHEAEDSQGESHCYFARQPRTPAELDAAIEAMRVACCGSLRYSGRDATVLARLAALGLEDRCDFRD